MAYTRKDIRGTSQPTPTLSTAERRAHSRLAARGEILLRLKHGDTVTPIRGDLLNVSADGFRLRHQNRDLRVGQELAATYGWGEVTVRMVWTTPIIGEYIESGFVIVSDGKAPRRWLLVCLAAALMCFQASHPRPPFAQQQQEGQETVVCAHSCGTIAFPRIFWPAIR